MSDAVRHFSEAPSRVKGVVERGDARRSRDERNHVAGVHYGHRPTNNHTATGAAHLRGSPENNKNKNKTQTQGRTIKKTKRSPKVDFSLTISHRSKGNRSNSTDDGVVLFFLLFYEIELGFIGFYWILPSFTWLLLGLIEFNWVLLGFC